MTFPVEGVEVDLKRSNKNEVRLKISKHSGGQYKCQVLIEGTFKSVSQARRMEVVQAELGPGGAGPSSGGTGGWQHHPTQRQQQHAQDPRLPHLSRQPHSAVQQHPSHLYGLSSVIGSGASSGPTQLALAVADKPSRAFVALLCLLIAAIAATATATAATTTTISHRQTIQVNYKAAARRV